MTTADPGANEPSDSLRPAEAEESVASGQPGSDVFDHLVLDDAFVAGARFQEEDGDGRIARASRIAADHARREAWRGDTAPGLDAGRRGRRSRGRRSVRTILAPIVALVVVAALVLWQRPGQADRPTASDGPVPEAPTSSVRVLPAPTIPTTGSSYAFLGGSDENARPNATWNPCEPIHYVVRPDNAPAGADRLLADGLAELTAATGLAFVSDGATSEPPSNHRQPFQPLTYSTKAWAPVLIAWSDATEFSELEGAVAGVGGALPYAYAGRSEHYVSGQVVLDAPEVSAVLRTGRSADAKTIVIHELGHLVGLDHVDDPSQIMNPSSSANSPSSYADGDRHGLALLGNGSCR